MGPSQLAHNSGSEIKGRKEVKTHRGEVACTPSQPSPLLCHLSVTSLSLMEGDTHVSLRWMDYGM